MPPIDNITTMLIAAIISLSGVVGYLFRESRERGKQEAECQKRVASLESQITATQALQEQMRWSGGLTAVVVINAVTQMIEEWSPGATVLLHWSEREMLGKPLARIIPPRFRDAHNSAIAALNQNKDFPRRGPIEGYALTKEGAEIPVEMHLSGWLIGSSRFVAAHILQRLDKVDADGKNSGGR